jgi:hypothetical protein
VTAEGILVFPRILVKIPLLSRPQCFPYGGSVVSELWLRDKHLLSLFFFSMTRRSRKHGGTDGGWTDRLWQLYS